MAMQLLPQLNYVFAVNVQIKQLANLQIIEIPIELHESYIISIKIFMSVAYAASLGQAYEKKAHTRQHLKVNFRLHIIKRIYTAASSSSHLPPLHRTTHYMKHNSLDGAFIVRSSSHRSSSKLRERSWCICNSEVRVRTISIMSWPLRHGHQIA